MLSPSLTTQFAEAHVQELRRAPRSDRSRHVAAPVSRPGSSLVAFARRTVNRVFDGEARSAPTAV
jgi:hypothetical protein